MEKKRKLVHYSAIWLCPAWLQCSKFIPLVRNWLYVAIRHRPVSRERAEDWYMWHTSSADYQEGTWVKFTSQNVYVVGMIIIKNKRHNKNLDEWTCGQCTSTMMFFSVRVQTPSIELWLHFYTNEPCHYYDTRKCFSLFIIMVHTQRCEVLRIIACTLVWWYAFHSRDQTALTGENIGLPLLMCKIFSQWFIKYPNCSRFPFIREAWCSNMCLSEIKKLGPLWKYAPHSSIRY